ncbi:sugar-phosphate isomerase, RpiB/LacA/LacB family [Lachnoanaerobaculum saburreum F0468]|uniref:Sugar-phosphate isomerase, RpiB/LacA/LacB family n=1 Tax=Lachnoanaerobaculum saburreum F0468 TaxID=1095750 RepID=I0R6D5_9FIRM|nr:RpiB/LacA/LacB family sugar-phosphate isomerase [Lachnoanaerobaculum saburreum]EIC95243.1 sugar-phosphate isomerase, RpiB/LacA/LacB family [Lachnoanaerobaculum saburreum F0468]
MMRIAIGSDPNAAEEKYRLVEFIKRNELGEIVDFGSDDVIYANVAIEVAEQVANKKFDRGILLCGTGLGMSIAANKVKGAYAALLSDIYSAKRAVLSNNANIACMGAFTIGEKLREELIYAFLTNEFDNKSPSKVKVDAYVEYDVKR